MEALPTALIFLIQEGKEPTSPSLERHNNVPKTFYSVSLSLLGLRQWGSEYQTNPDFEC